MFKHTVEERHVLVCYTIKENIEAASIKTSIHYRLAKPFLLIEKLVSGKFR